MESDIQKVINVIINGKKEPIYDKTELGYEFIVEKAFGHFVSDAIVTYTGSGEPKPDGELEEGKTVKIEEGTKFDVKTVAKGEYKIIVNAREEIVKDDNISYREVAILALGKEEVENALNDPDKDIVVTYEYAYNNASGQLEESQSVKIVEGTKFNVHRTVNS